MEALDLALAFDVDADADADCFPFVEALSVFFSFFGAGGSGSGSGGSSRTPEARSSKALASVIGRGIVSGEKDEMQYRSLVERESTS